jgi:predicted amidohydrolase YtcJ
VAAVLLSACGSPPVMPAPDRIYVNGRIWTGEAAAPEAQAIAVRGDRIVAVGSDSDLGALADAATEVIDLEGRRVVPGFNDAHWHLPTRHSADLTDAGNVAELQRRLTAFAATIGADDWIVGRGWGPSDFPGNEAHRRYLDDLFPNRPVVLTDRDGHQALANGRALALAKVTRGTRDPANGRIVRDGTGAPTGLLQESAASLVRRLIPPLNAEQVYQALLREVEKAASFGLTSVQVASGVGGSGLEYQAYQRALREGALKVRVRLGVPFERDVTDAQLSEFVALRDRHRDGVLAYGVAKGMLDGTVDAYTAAMHEPYADRADTGLPMWTQPDLNRTVAAFDKAGIQVQLHAIGDRAIRMALDAFAHAATANGSSGRRHRIEHIEVPATEDLPRFKALGVIASTQAMFASPDAITLTNYAPALGPERASRSNAFKLFDDAGAVQAFGSDYPVFTMEVMRGIHAAVTREMPDGTPEGGWYPQHRIAVADAVRHFTRDGAFATFDEANKGTLAVGKWADFAVLSEDIFAIPTSQLHAVRVWLTVMGGRETHRAKD